jgi:hypothetical protein
MADKPKDPKDPKGPPGDPDPPGRFWLPPSERVKSLRAHGPLLTSGVAWQWVSASQTWERFLIRRFRRNGQLDVSQLIRVDVGDVEPSTR